VKICDQFRELIQAYALGALDGEDRAAFEAHLATGCSDCAKTVEEARWLVSQLAYLAPEATPSDMLKGRLMQTVHAEASQPRIAAPSKTGIPFWMWAGVAALVVLSLYSALEAGRLRVEIHDANERAAAILRERQQLQEQLAVAKREAMIVTDPASVKIPLAGQDPQAPQLEAKWHSQLGICVMGHNVPMPAANRVLQLWLIPKAPGAKPMPSMTLRPDPDGKLVLLVSNPPESMSETKALAITEEPEGGSLQPTTTPRWVGGVG